MLSKDSKIRIRCATYLRIITISLLPNKMQLSTKMIFGEKETKKKGKNRGIKYIASQ